MRIFAALAGVMCMSAPVQVWADDADSLLEVFQGYKSCFEVRDSDQNRLACYDGLAAPISKIVENFTANNSTPTCEVEDWTPSMRGSKTYMTGSLTCESGRLDYRIYDKETDTFLASGFTFFQGYAFRDYPGVSEWPATSELKVVIDAD